MALEDKDFVALLSLLAHVQRQAMCTCSLKDLLDRGFLVGPSERGVGIRIRIGSG